MFPKLFQLGPITLRTYGLFIALGFLAALGVASHLRRREGLPTEHLSNLALWMIGTGIVFARAAYVIEHWKKEFADVPFTAVLRIDQGGLMFFGGFIGALLTLVLYAKLRRESFLGLADLLAVVLPLGHAFGRIGCFFFGCCHGKITVSGMNICFPKNSPAWNLHTQMFHDNPDAIPYFSRASAAQCLNHQSLPVVPTQLIEAAANFLVFFLLFFLYRRPNRATGFITGLYLMLYAVLRFAIENLRGDIRATPLLSLSIAQTIGLGTFLLGAIITAFALCRARRQG